MLRLAQRYLLDPMGRQKAEEKSAQTQAKPRQHSPAPGQVFRSRNLASLTRVQVKLYSGNRCMRSHYTYVLITFSLSLESKTGYCNIFYNQFYCLAPLFWKIITLFLSL